ncbi:response regulator [Novosphingobium pituita]|uniref:Response regulator n=1 Tax=Novosphingobium pituita TaxID=3056842 RepID=A0ABQ6PBX9_9SPHN|nr:response regulator [Novosphingobium sp. IK01]MDK4805786.1 response regulator [Novosphingobium aromaticivorans]GMM62405.1 response regulator [Novosphingobium sp. IK01]HIQ17183.1 response regulator [Novosphingobium capsulatum]
MTDRMVDILVVDDDELTVEMVARSLAKVGPGFRAIAACDGLEALDILRGRSPLRLKRPHIVLLDLNMPRMNGFEFLEAIRSDDELSQTVVFVLTTSDADSDLTRAYREQVAGYMVKSHAGQQFARVASLLCEYRQTVHLPV